MAKKAKFEIYEGFTKRKKKYIVVNANLVGEEELSFCKKFFRCSDKHLYIAVGYILDKKLYLEDPGSKKAKDVFVVTYIR